MNSESREKAALPREFRTDRLILRTPRPEDADVIFSQYAQDPEVTRFLTWRPHQSIDQTRQFVQRCLLGWQQGTPLAWAIKRIDEDVVLGMVEVRLGEGAELGYVLARAEWGKGYMTEAVRAVTTPEFDLRAAKLGCYRTGSLAEKRETIDAILGATKYLPQDERDDVVKAIQEAGGNPLPDDLMMTDEQVRFLRDAGMEVGAHTRKHPILAKCTPAQAQAEIADGRDDLAALLGTPPRLFAYPNGKPGTDYDATHVELVKRTGFDAAVSTSGGAARAGDDPYQLPRFTPWARKQLHFGLRITQNLLANREVRV